MPIYEGEDACKQCEGWGKVDDGDEGVSWGIWAALPPGADIAVKLGVVKPITCPRCGGTGEDPEGWGGKEPKLMTPNDAEIKLGVVTLDDDFELSEDEQRVGEALLGALKTLRTNKPTERNERARRYAVTITEMEKVWAYFHTWVIADRMKGDDIR